MYEKVARPNPSLFYQGDILDGFPFFIISETFNLLERGETENTYEIKKAASLPEGQEAVIGAFEIRPHRVILLSQTCDIQNSQTVLVAPVYSLQEVRDNGALSEGNVNLVRKRRGSMKDWFYLPASDGQIGESFVDFSTIHYFPKELLNGYLDKRIIGLTDWGRHLLDWALGDYLGRPIEDKYRI